MGTLSGDGYYQDLDEDRYYDSWEFLRDEDRRRGINLPDAHYIAKHIPAKRLIMGLLVPAQETKPIMTPSQKVEAVDRYAINKAAKVGDTIQCACCNKTLTKTHYQQAFCPPINGRRGKRYVCKDKYHNLTDPERAARANIWSGK